VSVSIDPDLFRAVLGRFASGITVITVRDREGCDHGMTVSAFSSLSLDPPLVLVCVGHDASMAGALAEATHVGVNMLSHGQESLSRRFAGKYDDRFEGLGVSRAPSEVAILDDVLAWIDGRIVARHEAGDHVIVVLAVEHGEARDGRPLLYYRGGYAQLER
jgi:flavin reductase (DIM6/NTAB) family NADH-FMN oxidoreductase RutF